MTIKEVVSEIEIKLRGSIPLLESRDISEITKGVFQMAVFLNSKREVFHGFDLGLYGSEYLLPKNQTAHFERHWCAFRAPFR